MTGALSGRVALVAGGTGTIGRATVRLLAEAGASVAVHHRDSAELARQLVEGIPGRHLAVQADVGDPARIDAAVAAVETGLGPVDVLVNTVHPANPAARVAELTTAQLEAQFAGVTAHAALCARVVPGMRERGWGRVVFVSGALMSRPAPGFGAYGAVKAAASTLTRYLALEEGRAGITANIVAPGRVVDPEADVELDAAHAALAERLLERTALGRFPTPEEVGRAVLLLTGPGSGAITAQTIWVTGGEPIVA